MHMASETEDLGTVALVALLNHSTRRWSDIRVELDESTAIDLL
jgi:hypothetical protein